MLSKWGCLQLIEPVSGASTTPNAGASISVIIGGGRVRSVVAAAVRCHFHLQDAFTARPAVGRTQQTSRQERIAMNSRRVSTGTKRASAALVADITIVVPLLIGTTQPEIRNGG